jgi:hypothetical protein
MSRASLEQRIATGLGATDVTAADLGQLIAETEAAITAADKTAEAERTKALDPALSPDPKAAREAMQDAEFCRDRLKTLLPRLQQRHKEITEAEALAAWKVDAAELEKRRVALGVEFRKFYPGMINRIIDHLHDMRAIDKEIDDLNLRRPHGADAVAWVTPHFAMDLKIPDPDIEGGPLLWPPPQPTLAQQMARAMMENPRLFNPPGPGPEWWKTIEERNRRMLEDNRRQIAEAEQRQREFEERQAAEIAAAKQRDKEEAAARGWPVR